jgi:dipeptidyl aminopeptidase/acylaminoacyl peptidase
MLRFRTSLALVTLLLNAAAVFAQDRLQSSDLLRLRSVSDVEVSPDGSRVAYTVENNDGNGRPYGQLWVMTLADGKTTRLGGDKEPSGNPTWSPDGQWLAYRGRVADRAGLVIAHPDGSGARFLAEMSGTNSPLPTTGRTVAWAPDGKRIAFVSSVPGPETADATGDPVVITRYLYKPDAGEGSTRFNDNRRLHIFVLDVASGRIDQLTDGTHYEHSIDWSPTGDEIAFVSNREPNEDQFFNYDLFVLKVADKSIRRLTSTENAEYRPRWSPDGRTIAYQATKRGLTDLETTMEDTHVWTIGANGTNRREIGRGIDNRQGAPEWSADGRAVLFTVQERGNSHLYRLPLTCGAEAPGRRSLGEGGCPAEKIVGEAGSVGAISVAKTVIAYTLATPSDQAELYVAGRKLTDLNADLLRGKRIAEVEAFTFISNDNKFEVEAFLTKPIGLEPADATSGASQTKYPLIVNIHGGPHGQQGPSFNFRNQVYAARGWATLMVNYRGSTGYGQAFTDAVFADQNGNEGQDVLYGLSAAMRRNQWIDRDRLGVEGTSYGGQLSAWLITQTSVFKAAIPTAAIINLISYNYMTYYNQYEQMEWGVFPHQGDLMDTLLARSAIRHVANAHTPTMLMHGENDNDVPIAEAEQFYIGLRDVGTEAVMVRYPREGHGIRESRHVVDSIDRSIRWYEAHFPPPTLSR